MTRGRGWSAQRRHRLIRTALVVLYLAILVAVWQAPTVLPWTGLVLE